VNIISSMPLNEKEKETLIAEHKANVKTYALNLQGVTSARIEYVFSLFKITSGLNNNLGEKVTLTVITHMPQWFFSGQKMARRSPK